MSLEDDFSDVLRKAISGLALDIQAISQDSSIPIHRIEALLRGQMDEQAISAIAPLLGLGADALLHLSQYAPQPICIPGLRRISLPYKQGQVNVFEIEGGGARLLFDTGYNAKDFAEQVSFDGMDAAWITHAHEDHVGGMKKLEDQGIRIIFEREAREQKLFHFGDLEVEVLDLSGHASPAFGYFVNGLSRRLFIAGDAIFAGSMGGCKSADAYLLASFTLKNALAKEAADLVILPGHGPITTLGEELVANPFASRFHPSAPFL